MENGWHKFSVSMENITLLADAGEFFALIGGANPWLLLEVRVWQRGTTTLTVDTLIFRRGTGAAGGTGLTEYKYGTAGSVNTVTGVSLPTTDIVTVDWEYKMGWNLLQEAVFLPTPELWLPGQAADDFAITRSTTTAHTGVGVQASWAEFIGS